MAAKPEEEEAARLKTLAEEKYKESELESALEYARQAESLNQNLDGIRELVTTYSILQEASSSPTPNWYKILQVESFSHINTIKKQYRKLALTLHPDKNPSCSASEEAFKHVSEAFRLLSDKIRKKDFDVKLKIAMQSAAVSSNGIRDDGTEKVDMFATKCVSCKSVHQFERRKFIGQSLVCPRCKKSFVAEEMRVNDGELDDGDETRVVVDRSRRKRKATITDFLDRIGLTSKVPKKKVKFADEMTLSEMQMKAKRKNEEGTVGIDKDMGKEKEKAWKVKETMDKGENTKEKMTLKEMAEKIEKKKKMDAVQNAEKVNEKTMTLKDMLKKMEVEKEQKMKTAENTGKLKEKKVKKVKDITEILGTEKAMTLKEMLGDIEKKKEKKSKTVETTEKDTAKEGETMKEKTLTLKEMVEKLGKAKGKDKGEEPEKAKDKNKVEKKSKGKKKGKEKKKTKKKEKGKEREERVVVAVSERSNDLEAMAVEDSDFYSFDKDRSEHCFKKCQIWAAYGDDDGMPRHYGLVDEIISLNPFKVKVSWLDLQGKGDNVSSCLERSGCQISCGKFKVDGKTVVNSVNIFSHIVECERVAREIYMIYPKKGSVWALYGGSDRHDINQGNVVNGCYDIVVILTNYSEMHGLSVAYLDKVKWFKTIFERREIGGHAVRWIEKDNVRLFSHQIPSRKLLGTEAPGLPKDCWELDPAALPQDLLVVEKDYLLGAA
ncbi:hypothetical protein MKW98_007469 [Papaver atlanticum]|uniref:J domain-containing protein n=1 Tax=Papaver atlanticum TaxID=357466 RepID=A0AAD4SCG4_9MAGN|nr:hypothetical protein MKW98_007469 [Papaver atlanticum]